MALEAWRTDPNRKGTNMADAKGKTGTAGTDAAGAPNTDGKNTANQREKPARELRAAFSEIGRLSQTLGLARAACYTNDADKVVKALKLIERQLPLAIETAELLVPAGTD